MKNFEYGDKEVGMKDMAITISSITIGVAVLTLPRIMTSSTQSTDGWIPICIGGIVCLIFAWILAKFSSIFYKQGFFEYTASLVTKPVSILITSTISIYYILYASYEVRAIASISKQYLFERTPVEFLALAFLLIVSYAVSGTRIGVIRLNLLFFPLVIIIIVVVLLFSGSMFHFEDVKPFFTTDYKHIFMGVKDGIFSLMGFECILFYITLMNKPKDAPKAAIIGVSIPLILYLVIYIICIGVFSQQGVLEVTYPVVELAKEVQIPGEFFERFESIFFTIWSMTIFNSACMAFDLVIYTLSSMVTKVKKTTWVFMLSPLIYLVCMFPRNLNEFMKLSDIMGSLGLIVAIFVPSLLFLFAKIRGVKKGEERS